LVEIGGAFRIPDIMARSGATLVEVGTTNRTHLRDYEGAVSDRTKLLLKVHRSNFEITGFTAEVAAQEIAGVAHAHGAASLYDLGSGLLLDLSPWGLAGEPTVAEALASGVDAVVFSGDKLLGGPQAGILLGTRAAIDGCRKDPLARAVRSDKFTLAALEATLAVYRDPERARVAIPVLRMLTEDVEQIRQRAEALRSEEHTSELQSLRHLVCRLLLEKKKINRIKNYKKKIKNIRHLLKYHPPINQPPNHLYNVHHLTLARSYHITMYTNTSCTDNRQT